MDKAEILRAPYASADAAFAAIEAAGLNKGDFKIIPSANAGEFLIMELQKPEAKAAKLGKMLNALADSKAKAKGEGKPAAKRGRDARLAKQSEAKPEAKAKAKGADEMAAFAEARKLQGKWGKLSQRRWLGNWAQMEAAAKAGKLPEAQSAKASEAMLAAPEGKEWAEASASAFGGIFSANTHWPFRKRICALAALIRAKDEKALKALEIKEISTTPAMLGKLRDLAIAALAAKADKAEAKAAKPGNGASAPPAAPPAA
jgi:hypothetical protein